MSFTLSLFIWACTTLLYILTDQISSWVHHPYYEFRIWVALISLLINIVLFYFTRLLTGYNLSENKSKTFLQGLIFAISVSCVIVPTISAFLVNLWLRSRLNKYQFKKASDDLKFLIKMKDTDTSQRFTILRNNESAARKARQITKILTNLVKGSSVNTVVSLTRRKKRAKIFKILSSCTSEEINDVLLHVNLPQLFTYGLYFSTNIGNSTIEYIIDKRDSDLTTFARASLIHALMRTSTLSFSEIQAQWAVKSFTGCTGEELTLLKRLIDSSGDYNNLFKLVFLDLPGEKYKNKILRHIMKQAREVLILDQHVGRRRIKILSDVDDTLYSSGGRFPAGSDDRLPRHVTYPGVLQLFEEIDNYALSSATLLPDAKIKKSIKARTVEEIPKEKKDVEEGLQRLMHDELEKFLENNIFIETKAEMDMKSLSIVGKSTYNIGALFVDNKKAERIKVTVNLPWKVGSGEELFICDADVDFEELSDKIEEIYGLPQWKQQVTIEPYTEGMAQFKHGNLVFLSARPNVYKDISERQSYTIFQDLNKRGLLHTTPTMLTGSLSSGLEAMFLRYRDNFYHHLDKATTQIQETVSNTRLKQRTNAVELVEKGRRLITNHNWLSVAKTKVKKFKEYSLLYPEYRFLFFGDDGQGDLFASEKMMKYFSQFQSLGDRRLIRCFIHRCYKGENSSIPLSSLSNPSIKDWEKMGIFFFNTYVGAALECLENNLISAKGLWRVATRSVEETLKLIEEYPNHSMTLYCTQLNQDIAACNEVLGNGKDNFAVLPTISMEGLI